MTETFLGNLLFFGFALTLGISVSILFSGIESTRKNKLTLGFFYMVFLIVQSVCLWFLGWDMLTKLYPLLVHLPSICIFSLCYKRPWRISAVSVFSAFLCCQPPLWALTFCRAFFDHRIAESVVYGAAAFLTYYLLKKYTVRPFRQLIEMSVKSCVLLGAITFFYYVFDYGTTTYTGILFRGAPWAVYLMFSGVSIFYFVFIVIYHAEMQKQTALQRERDILDMQFKQQKYEAEIERLELLAKVHYDPLTGIYNRRYLDEKLDHAMKLFSRIEGNIGIFMMDIDFFKRYNDTYGHKQGDECLKAVAKALSDSLLREDDFVARFGGEEFIAVLLNADEKGIRLIAEKMLNNILALKFLHEKNEAAEYVTISIGITSGKILYTQNTEDYIRQGDKALYISKQNGRNRYTYLDMEYK